MHSSNFIIFFISPILTQTEYKLRPIELGSVRQAGKPKISSLTVSAGRLHNYGIICLVELRQHAVRVSIVAGRNLLGKPLKQPGKNAGEKGDISSVLYLLFIRCCCCRQRGRVSRFCSPQWFMKRLSSTNIRHPATNISYVWKCSLTQVTSLSGHQTYQFLPVLQPTWVFRVMPNPINRSSKIGVSALAT